VQVPAEPLTLQLWHAIAQLVLQHTVSRQKPDRHQPELVPQLMPASSFGVQLPPLQ
jgi:hypothetical protein